MDWSDEYDAQVTESRTPIGWVRHLKVKRRHERDDIGWGVLQTIKNELPGPDAFAVEFYPPVIDVMDENNMRHLWGSAEPPPLRPARRNSPLILPRFKRGHSRNSTSSSAGRRVSGPVSGGLGWIRTRQDPLARFCKLQILESHNSHTCRRCRGAVHAVARTVEFTSAC
jgi:hypothetical protein